jgi:hypothetical protein
MGPPFILTLFPQLEWELLWVAREPGSRRFCTSAVMAIASATRLSRRVAGSLCSDDFHGNCHHICPLDANADFVKAAFLRLDHSGQYRARPVCADCLTCLPTKEFDRVV